MFDYIDNAYARAWVSSRFNSRRGVFIPLAFIDINDGNLYDAMLFSQIMYWHEPSTESGKPRLTIKKDGNYWLAKNHGDWFDECRINKSTVRKCLDRLKERKLIEYELHGFDGDKTPFVRVNWSTFETLMKNWEKEQADKSGHPPALREQGGMPQENIGVSQQVKPNTETTAKTTEIETTAEEEKALSAADVFRAYEINIGMLTPKIRDTMNDWLTDVPAEWLIEALDLAVEYNKRSWAYAETILKRWKAQGKDDGKKATKPSVLNGKPHTMSPAAPEPDAGEYLTPDAFRKLKEAQS